MAADIIGIKVVRVIIRQHEVNTKAIATFISIGNDEYRTNNTPKKAQIVINSTSIGLLTVQIFLSITHKPSANADISGNKISGSPSHSETPTIKPIMISVKTYRINLNLVILFTQYVLSLMK